MSDESRPADLAAAAAELVPLLYEDVRRVARQQRLHFRPGETLRTTALVNEAYLKLMRSPAFNDHRHFLRAAAMAMRQIITDMARAKLSDKRGSGAQMLPLDEEACEVPDGHWPGQGEDRIVALDEAVSRLAAVSPRMADIVQCRFFAGYDEKETAEALGISERTLRREWVKAKAWLFRELENA